jgi:hypothetical protein
LKSGEEEEVVVVVMLVVGVNDYLRSLCCFVQREAVEEALSIDSTYLVLLSKCHRHNEDGSSGLLVRILIVYLTPFSGNTPLSLFWSRKP